MFLPGYDDLVKIREVLSESRWFTEGGQHSLFVLHSNMQSGDQRRVFRPVPAGTRKVVLSTNIAETSVTIQDIVYVIDTGKVKEVRLTYYRDSYLLSTCSCWFVDKFHSVFWIALRGACVPLRDKKWTKGRIQFSFNFEGVVTVEV